MQHKASIILLAALILSFGCRRQVSLQAGTDLPSVVLATTTVNTEISRSATLTPTKTSPQPAPTASPSQTPTSTVVIEVPPDWSGEWEVSINSPTVSILKIIRFELPAADGSLITAAWTEGSRPVYLEAELQADGRVLAGTFWNSDAELLAFSISMAADGKSFSGSADGDSGPGSFCGARPGQPRPRPCRGDG
jgi:hypothetical protein